jgi:hypothetical protein
MSSFRSLMHFFKQLLLLCSWCRMKYFALFPLHLITSYEFSGSIILRRSTPRDLWVSWQRLRNAVCIKYSVSNSVM